jgi:hypothetical protein
MIRSPPLQTPRGVNRGKRPGVSRAAAAAKVATSSRKLALCSNGLACVQTSSGGGGPSAPVSVVADAGVAAGSLVADADEPRLALLKVPEGSEGSEGSKVSEVSEVEHIARLKWTR